MSRSGLDEPLDGDRLCADSPSETCAPLCCSNSSVGALKNRGPLWRPTNIWFGGGTSSSEPKAAEKVGMVCAWEGKSTFSGSRSRVGDV
jgi:hypothetical protein